MTKEQVHALLLAEELDCLQYADYLNHHEAAAELRRLHSVNAELLEALQHLMVAHGEQLDYAFQQAQKAIAKATGEPQ